MGKRPARVTAILEASVVTVPPVPVSGVWDTTQVAWMLCEKCRGRQASGRRPYRIEQSMTTCRAGEKELPKSGEADEVQ